MKYTTTGKKTKPKERMSTETTDTENSSKTLEAQHAEEKQRNTK
jgi:hypothetical protein